MSPEESKVLHDIVFMAQLKLDRAVDKFLTSHDWLMSCSNPQCKWLWMKAIDDKTYMVNTKEALEIEKVFTINNYSGGKQWIY